MADQETKSDAVHASLERSGSQGRAKTQFRVRQSDFSFSNVTVRVPGDKGGPMKVILDHVSGHVRPGEVVAVMGPSGSGKTTLLNALVGRLVGSKLVTTGKVLVDGKPRGKLFKRQVSYVTQENALMGVLTVRESMSYAAELAGASGPQVPAMVADTIHELGLDDCQDTRVGDVFFKGISGGQQRRLSLGVELMKQPSILLLDEPTSGLDSAAAFGVMQSVKDLAAAGRTVLATIHQPSADVFHMCDKVLLLSRGRAMYFGPTKDIVPYFKEAGYPCPQFTNPADFVMDLVNTDFENHADIDELGANYKAKQHDTVLAEALALDESHPTFTGHARLPLEGSTGGKELNTGREGEEYSCSVWQQFSILSRRNMLNNIRNPGVFWVRLVMYVGLALMIGLLYLGQGTDYNTIQDRFALLFFTAAFLVFMSIAALPFLIDNRTVFLRERGNGAYSNGPYVLSTVVTFLPGLAIIALASSVLIYFMAGLHDGADHFFVFVLDLFLSLCIAESFMLCVAAVVPHYIIGIAVGAGLFGAFMLTEGFLVQRDAIPDYLIWMYYIGFHTYGFRVFIFNEFDGLTFKCSDSTINLLVAAGDASAPTTCRLDGRRDILPQLSMEDVDVTNDLIVLLAFMVGFVLIFYAILRVKYPGKVAEIAASYQETASSKQPVATSASAAPAPAPAAAATAPSAAAGAEGEAAAV